MSEPRKNHLTIDGGQVKEEEHVASYKPIPETDTEFRSSKNNLAKSKEKLSPDGAEEKLLPKEQEAKIVTRVDMADAKYVVEDHRNGDAKIELDANKRQFSGLTKEELMKYADDPFWVNLRWFMFVLFWAMWVCMLAGAITIIVKAPKCSAPVAKTWSQKGPLIDYGNRSFTEIVISELERLEEAKVQGIFVDVPTYTASPSILESFQNFTERAKKYGVKVIVDLIPNYVSKDHEWFQKSVKGEFPFTDYFVWAAGTDSEELGGKTVPSPPNTWRSIMNTSAWTYNEERKQFYLHQYAEAEPDLNFNNEQVVQLFDKVIREWMHAGAAGVRLSKARHLLVNTSFPKEELAQGRGAAVGATHEYYDFWRHSHTVDQPGLDGLFKRFGNIVRNQSEEAVFTLEEEIRPELFLLDRDTSSLSPVMTAPITVTENVTALAIEINARLKRWPAMQLTTTPENEIELASFALLLPASPVFKLHQLEVETNATTTESLPHLISLREDASIEHGNYTVEAVPVGNATENTLIVCARWKPNHTGYLAVYNPSGVEARANLKAVTSLPDELAVHHMSRAVKSYADYSSKLNAGDVLVPPKSTLVLSYVPRVAAEK